MIRILAFLSLLAASAHSPAADDNADRFNEGWYAYQDGNYEEALRLWVPLAKAGDVEAQHYAGELYRDGLGDSAAALGWFEKAAAQGYVKAQTALGFAYLDGEGVSQDDAVAFEWFQRSAMHEDAVGQAMLGFMYEHGRGTTKDIAKSISWYRLAAKQGHTWSQNALGRIYHEGKDVETDNPMSCYWYDKAAKQGDGFAKYRMGYCYARGWGRDADPDMAIDFFQQAVDRDIAEAVGPLEWYANAGYAEARYTLAQLYGDGRFVGRDHDRAFSLASEAAKQGHVGSLAFLGACYLDGMGVAKDESRAEDLLLDAALKNSARAKHSLARLYAGRGGSLSINVTRAAVWAYLAVMHTTSGPDVLPDDAVIAGLLNLLGGFDGVDEEIFEIFAAAQDGLSEEQRVAAEELAEIWQGLYDRGLPGVTKRHLRDLTPPHGHNE